MNKVLVSTNPGKNYQVIGEVEVSSEEEVAEKVRKANLAKQEWKDCRKEGRVKILGKLANQLSDNKQQLAKIATLEMGMPITQSLEDVDSAMQYLNWYLENAVRYLSPEITFKDARTLHRVFYEPVGVAAVITPWNFPLSNFIWGVIPNLIAGNPVVFKHSEECPVFGKLLESIVGNIALPEGVFAQVYGDGVVGDFLVHQDIDLICFTGSSRVGKHLYQVGAGKFIKVVLELGGSAPGIVFEDADVDQAVESIYFSRFSNCGQMCDGLKRLIVHESLFDKIVEKLGVFIKAKKLGDPESEATDIGPLVAKRQLKLLEEQVVDAIDNGATLVLGGGRPTDLQGAYFNPTILTAITPQMRVWQEEVFGPVLPIVRFKTQREAVELANDTKYGLGAYIFTANKEKALDVASQLESGMISINGINYVVPANPFGGYKESGIGREHGKYGLRELSQIKLVALEK